MQKLSTRAAVASFVAVALLAVGLTGCSAAASPSHPVFLTGTWKQDNSKSFNAYQTAVITSKAPASPTITIYWVSDGGDTKSLYWAGSSEGVTNTPTLKFTSKNGTSLTKNALLASSDPTKKFSYANGELSYSVSALGTTTIVKLKKVHN